MVRGLRIVMGCKLGAAVVAAAVAVVAIAPRPARAETPIAQVTLYEVDEALKFKKRGSDVDAVMTRLANASLLGGATDVQALVDNPIFVTGSYVKADAASNVNTATLSGPVHGTINLLQDLDPTRNSLDTLLITQVLDINATLDLSPTASKIPMAPITGRWRVANSRVRGTFQGVFLIPFDIGGGNYFYLDPSPWGFKCKGALLEGTPMGTLCQVHSTEFVLGIPMTKALLTFSQR